jgi:hypothetical protein
MNVLLLKLVAVERTTTVPKIVGLGYGKAVKRLWQTDEENLSPPDAGGVASPSADERAGVVRLAGALRHS